MKDFARGCMRSYLMLKQKAAQWNANQEIQSILKELGKAVPGTPAVGKYSKQGGAALLNHEFNKARNDSLSTPGSHNACTVNGTKGISTLCALKPKLEAVLNVSNMCM